MNSIFGLMATSGGNFVSIAHLEIPLLIKMLMCQILIFPAVYIYKNNCRISITWILIDGFVLVNIVQVKIHIIISRALD